MTYIKKFLFKLFLLGAILTISILILNKIYIVKTFPYEYLGGMLNDKHQMAQGIASPKVLFVGGSSGSFGVNSDTLEKALGMPVVNMSFMAPLGTYFLLNDALKEVKRGDKVFVTTEYDIDRYSTPQVLFSAADYYPETKKFIKKDSSFIDEIRNVLTHKLANVRKLFWNTFTTNEALNAKVSDNTAVYFRHAFSPKGDIISHVNNSPKAINYCLFPKEPTDYSGQIEDLNTFAREAHAKGAEVFYVFPPLAQSTYDCGKKAVESINAQLRANVSCKIVGNVNDFVRPDSLFFDSFYHLNPYGRDLNTKKIIELYQKTVVQ